MTAFHTLAEALRHRAGTQPDCPAYTFLRDGEIADRTITYAGLDLESRALAAMLREWQVERPLLIYAPGLDFVVAFFACLYAGIPPIPAGLHHVSRIGRSLARLCAIAAGAGADAVLSTTRVIDRALGDPEFADHAPGLAGMRWLSTESPDLGWADSCREPAMGGRDTPAFIQYTSGSTAAPKGVVITHRNALHNLAVCNAVEENDERSISVSWLPHSHDMGLIEAILLPLFAGYRAYLMSPAAFLSRPARWLQAVSRFHATNSGGPNFAYDLCVDRVTQEEKATLDLRSWRVAYNGAETIRKETLLRFRDGFQQCGFRWNAFYPVYGLAESTLIVSSGLQVDCPVFCELDAAALGNGMAQTEREAGARTVSAVACGRGSNDSRIVIVNPDTLKACPPDGVGEIWLSSPSVAAGYWNNPSETERVFGAYLAEYDNHAGPFLRTGDLGFLREGRLFVTGRIKDVINIRGFKHYPQDIELTVAGSHPAIQANACAAFAIACDGVEQLAAVAEMKPRWRHQSEGWPEQVIGAIQNAITEDHGLAVHAVVLAPYGTIPRTTSGKLQRHACRSSLIDGTLKSILLWSVSGHFGIGAV